MRFASAAVLIIAAAGMAMPAPASAQEALGGIGLRLVEAPETARDDPRARIYIADHLAPGTAIERRVEVSNTSAATHDVALYASAATVDEGVFVGAAGTTQNELSRWTTAAPGEVQVRSGETLTAMVKVAVPADAAPGEQYAVVWAEARSAVEASSVTQVSRVGIRLYVSVGPGAAPAPDFTVSSLTPSRSDDGAPVITAAVRNTGGRALTSSRCGML